MKLLGRRDGDNEAYQAVQAQLGHDVPGVPASITSGSFRESADVGQARGSLEVKPVIIVSGQRYSRDFGLS